MFDIAHSSASKAPARPAPWQRSRFTLALGGLLLLAACASAPKPDPQMAAGRAALESAQAAGAQQNAPAEFEAARQKLALAEQALKRDDYELARRLAEAAEADARLAQARAAAARSRAAAGEIEQSLRTLQDELNRSAK